MTVDMHSGRAHQLAALHVGYGQGCSKGLVACTHSPSFWKKLAPSSSSVGGFSNWQVACAHPASLLANVPSARAMTYPRQRVTPSSLSPATSAFACRRTHLSWHHTQYSGKGVRTGGFELCQPYFILG